MKKNQNDICLYKTKKYNEAVEKSKISLEQAIDIVCKSKEYQPFLQHHLIYKNEYIFTTLPPTHAGTLVIKEGLRINIDTGELLKINEATYQKQRVQIEKSIGVKCK